MFSLDDLLEQLKENMEEIERSLLKQLPEKIERSKPSPKAACAAFDRELALLEIEREEMNAQIARGKYLRLIISRKLGLGIYCPEDNDVFMTKLFFALYEGEAIVVGIQPDLTISPVVYRNGRYEFDQVDLGHMAGGYSDVHIEGIYTGGVVSAFMASGELIIDGLSLAK